MEAAFNERIMADCFLERQAWINENGGAVSKNANLLAAFCALSNAINRGDIPQDDDYDIFEAAFAYRDQLDKLTSL